jgi:hypothetical protein
MYAIVCTSLHLQTKRRLRGARYRSCGRKECNNMAVLKWILTAVFATLAWLVTGYTVEYFRPYKRK